MKSTFKDMYAAHWSKDGRCFYCGVPVPCEVRRLLDALAASERREGELRYALQGLVEYVPLHWEEHLPLTRPLLDNAEAALGATEEAERFGLLDALDAAYQRERWLRVALEELQDHHCSSQCPEGHNTTMNTVNAALGATEEVTR